MWHNDITYGTVLRPTFIMDEQIGNNIGSKGSYEVYEPQKNGEQFPVGESAVNGIDKTGNQGSQDEYLKQRFQVVCRELEQSKIREAELQHYINLLKAPKDAQGATVEEGVKDAHIKYLQRQVTVLQANLYKYDGWSSKLMSATEERDKLLIENGALKSELSRLQDENRRLTNEVDTLSNSRADLQKRLQQAIVDLENVRRQSLPPGELRDELMRARSENKTLRESISRLELENRSIKDYSNGSGGSPSLGNVACSQELEYLHKVVDTLKSTVLEQRNFLLNMRNPTSLNPVKSTQFALAGSQSTEGLPKPSRGSPVPALQRSLPTVTQDAFQKISYRQSPEPFQKPLNPQPTALSDTKSLESSQGGGNVREVSSDESVSDSLQLHNMVPVRELNGYINMPSGMQEIGPEVKAPSRDDNIQLTLKSASHELQPSLVNKKAIFSDSARPQLPEGNGSIPKLSPQKFVAPLKSPHSEVISRRNGIEQPNADLHRSRSAVISRNTDAVPMDTHTPRWGVKSSSPQLEEFHGASRPAPGSQALFAGHKVPYDRRSWEASELMEDNMHEDDHAMTQSSKAQPQPVLHRQPNYEISSQTVPPNWEELSGAVLMPPKLHRPLAQTGNPGREADVQYINVLTNPADVPDPHQPRLNSDRICPVCNNNYDHFSMEDFQTHVFKCFDDENPPETMKPQEASRTCPMCSKLFDHNASQAEFEKHVHSHFGEEGPGDNFEILQ
ncbi:uncharacterized protein LOC131934526 isoform X2 [Physella acuta]|nr:uncharacterized protein LOC131934526 isoform X2 [Physella acuta]XP_059146551.1 uncharacterized protein LOC131934526 isoform X2 [Physella acuta]